MGSIGPLDGTEANSFMMDAKSDYAVKEQPLGTLRRVRIVTIGAGMSGINIIRTLRLNTSNFEHVVYEKNEEIGGTWFENRYPGCACDIPSHNYQFSHTPNPEWSCVFSESDEIQSYLQHVCDKHELREYIKLSHSVQHAQWDEESGKWILKVKDEVAGTTFEDRCDFLLDASGILNDWKWPDIKGLHSFKGDLIHSARWPKDFSYAEKTVAVIGNGSSGVQIVPALQPTVKKLVHILRSPTWISPPHTQVMAASPAAPFLSTIQFDAQGRFTESQMEEFKTDPQKYGKFVKVVEAIVNSRFPSLLNGSPEAMITRQIITQYMTHALNQDETLMKALIPDFPVGCRRMTPGVGYLDALTKPNVQTVITGIEEICPEGIKLVTGELIVVDAIVCATGFNLSFVPRFPIIGTSGNLQDIWKDSVPAAYMSCMVPNLPNYFTFLGPNAPIGHGSVVTITEHIAKYITKIIMKCQLEDITSVRPSPEAVKDFSEHIANFMPRTAWSASCSSWFKNGKKDGPVTALHPGSRIHWFHMLELPRWEDFEWKSAAKNRFAYLGNGLSTKEAPGQNSTWYLDAPDALW